MKGQHITKNQVNIRIGDAQKQNTWVGNDGNERGQTIRDAGSKLGEGGKNRRPPEYFQILRPRTTAH